MSCSVVLSPKHWLSFLDFQLDSMNPLNLPIRYHPLLHAAPSPKCRFRMWGNGPKDCEMKPFKGSQTRCLHMSIGWKTKKRITMAFSWLNEKLWSVYDLHSLKLTKKPLKMGRIPKRNSSSKRWLLGANSLLVSRRVTGLLRTCDHFREGAPDMWFFEFLARQGKIEIVVLRLPLIMLIGLALGSWHQEPRQVGQVQPGERGPLFLGALCPVGISD